MTNENNEKAYLVRKLYRNLVLVEIERALIKVSCNLMEDEIYKIDDAVQDIIEVLNLIEMERKGTMSDIQVYTH